ncbi:hypothetical protein scyTo_0025562, partial [Scyliorhinus torazame]|nr:hypothetical protein [Scyliorhinus torazame]
MQQRHNRQALKMVIVGDECCGKTCLQSVFTMGHCPE